MPTNKKSNKSTKKSPNAKKPATRKAPTPSSGMTASKSVPKTSTKIPTMGPKEMTSDCLKNETYCTSVYNTFANECVNPKLRNDFVNILKDVHDIQSEMFMEAQNRGWYVVKPAKQPDIQQAAKKYSGMKG